MSLRRLSLYELSEQAVEALKEQGLTVSFAESCTGGLLSKCITDVPGASDVLPGGVCAYSNLIKYRVHGVDAPTLDQYGAVSAPVALRMARGVKRLMGSSFGVGTTGIAGPASDNTEKPVGLVYIGLALPKGGYIVHEEHFSGSRDEIRTQTAEKALEYLLHYLK